MEYYGNTLCISYGELVDNNIISPSNYKLMAYRGNLNVVRRGGGSSGSCALIAVDSLPTKYRKKVEEAFPGGPEVRLEGWVTSHYQTDQKALAFFSDRRQTGLDLTAEKVQEYVVNASVLNTCIALYERAAAYRKLMGEKYDWDMMAKVVRVLKEKYHHTLPESMLRFRQKVNQYRKGGYEALISGKFGNQNTLKVDAKTERLVVELKCLPNKPYDKNTWDMYNAFVCGEVEVFDPKTGECFNPDDFTNKDGSPKELSESTIRNILNKPKNRAIIDRRLLGYSTALHEVMPHMMRNQGEYSLSQITMDDVDLTRKLKDTKQRVKAYYAYDVVSQCVIGASYSRTKDPGLVMECFRDMFRLIAKHGWGIPAGVEVENHLMSAYRYGLLQEGVVFSHVHYCAPLNSQEKYAEPLNGAKKRSIIHKNHVGIGRFYAKSRAYRVEAKKISDEKNDTYEDKEYFSFEQLVADDRRDSWEWNHALHPNQKKYKGMTRWDVLVDNINPSLKPFDEVTLARYIGESVETSVRRNSYVQVAYEKWWLSSPEVLERLAPNNYKVTAYYLPDEDGKPGDVFLFQGNRYIDQVERVETYNRVMAEQTEEDKRRFQKQQRIVAKWRKYFDDNAVSGVGVMRKETFEEIINEEDYEEIKETLTAEPPGAQTSAQEQQGLGVSPPDVPDGDDGVQGACGLDSDHPSEGRWNEKGTGTSQPKPSARGGTPDVLQGERQAVETIQGDNEGLCAESAWNDGISQEASPTPIDDDIAALLQDAESEEDIARRAIDMM